MLYHSHILGCIAHNEQRCAGMVFEKRSQGIPAQYRDGLKKMYKIC